jgi:hypothetical protein
MCLRIQNILVKFLFLYYKYCNSDYERQCYTLFATEPDPRITSSQRNVNSPEEKKEMLLIVVTTLCLQPFSQTKV